MHPPPFKFEQRLSEWPECNLELRCETCNGRSCNYPAKLLVAKRGDMTFSDALGKLVCEGCRQRPTSIYLCASLHRRPGISLRPDWAVQLI